MNYKFIFFICTLIVLYNSLYSQKFYTFNDGNSLQGVRVRNNIIPDLSQCSIDTGTYNDFMGFDDVHGFPDGTMLSLAGGSSYTFQLNVPFIAHQSELFKTGTNFFNLPNDPYYGNFNSIRSFTFDYKSNFYYAGASLYYVEYKGNKPPILIRPIDSIKQIVALSLYYDKLYGVQGFVSGNRFQGYTYHFVEFDRQDNYSFKKLFEFEVESDKGIKFEPFYTNVCLNTHTVSCDSTVLLLTVSGGHKSFRSLGTKIFIVDLLNNKLIPYCSYPEEIGFCGLASKNEVAHTKCKLALDLDDDNSTEFTNGYKHIAECPSDSLSLSDDDLYLYSIYYIDSMKIEYMNQPPDSNYEQLIFYPNSKLDLEYLNKHSIIIRNKGQANTQDFKAAIKNAKYINTNYPVVAGSRMFMWTIYTKDRIESAMTEIILPELRPAGTDNSITICPDAKDLELFLEIGFPKTKGGYWIEPTLGDSGWIRPGVSPSGVYHYVFPTSHCYFDTAQVTVQYYNTHAFNFGPDTTLCPGQSLTLKTGLDRKVWWMDNVRRFELVADTSGKYWAHINDVIGCTYSDTINVKILDSLDHINQNIVICDQATYNYKNKIYSIGNTIIDTITCNSICPEILNIYLIKDSSELKNNSFLTVNSNEKLFFNIHLQYAKINSISWMPIDGLIQLNDSSFVFQGDMSKEYIFSIENEFGCTKETKIFITVIHQEEIYAPNVFSPNKDNTNDFWEIISPPDFQILDCQIYNNWGNMVYGTNGSEIRWDGKFDGKYCVPSVYVYLIKYRDRSGNVKYLKGDITLLR